MVESSSTCDINDLKAESSNYIAGNLYDTQ